MNGNLLFLNDYRPDGRAVLVETAVETGAAGAERPSARDSNASAIGASAIGGGAGGGDGGGDGGGKPVRLIGPELKALVISAALTGLALAYALPGGWLTAIIAVALALAAPVPVMFEVTHRVHGKLLERIHADDAELILLRRARTQGAAAIVAQASEIARLTADLQAQSLTLDLIESGGMCPGVDPACCKLVVQAALLRASPAPSSTGEE
jgi:hypothetical protein